MFLNKFLNKNKKVEKKEKNEEVLNKGVEVKTVTQDEISEIINNNYSIMGNLLDIDVEPLKNIKSNLKQEDNEELFKKIDEFIEIINDIKNYNQDSLDDLISDIRTAKEIISDSNVGGGCVLDLIKDKKLKNDEIKKIKKILYHNLKYVDNLIFIVNDEVIKNNARILGIEENDFNKKMDEDADYIINNLLYKLTGNNGTKLSDVINLDENQEDKRNKKHLNLNSKLIKIIALSALLTIGATDKVFSQNKDIEKKIIFNGSNINLDNIFSSQASQKDIEKVKFVFRETFRGKEILKVLDENNIIQNLGWIKAVVTIDNEDLKEEIIKNLDNDKKIAYQQFLLFINAQKYFLEKDEKIRGQILENMGKILSELDKFKSVDNKVNVNNTEKEKQIQEIEDNILYIKKLITDKIYSTSSATMGSVYNETDTIKYIGSYGIKTDRDYVYSLYKQLKQEEAKLAQLKK